MKNNWNIPCLTFASSGQLIPVNNIAAPPFIFVKTSTALNHYLISFNSLPIKNSIPVSFPMMIFRLLTYLPSCSRSLISSLRFFDTFLFPTSRAHQTHR